MKNLILEEYVESGHLNKTIVDAVSAKIIVDEDCLIKTKDGKFVALYLTNVFNQKNVIEKIFCLPYQHADRLSGIGSDSLIFGFAPRDPIKKHPCRATPFNRTFQKEYFYLYKLAKKAEETLSLHQNEVLLSHKQSCANVSTSWMMADTVFSSGIINKSNQLIYHTDNGNAKGCFSAMYTFRKNCDDGFLHIPEYNLMIKNRHGSLLWFDGANVLHGVTRFKKPKFDSFRCTIVFYVLEKMKNCCKNQKEEIQHHNKKLSERFHEKNESIDQINR